MIPNAHVSICVFMHVQCGIGKAGYMHWIWNASLQIPPPTQGSRKHGIFPIILWRGKKMLLIFAISLAMRSCHGRMRSVYWEDVGSSDWDWLQSSPGELRQLNSFLLETGTLRLNNLFGLLFSSKKDYGENCLGQKLNRYPAKSLCHVATPGQWEWAKCSRSMLFVWVFCKLGF